MKESLDDTMRTIQEMRLIRNVQEEEGGGQRVHTHSPLQDLAVGLGVRQSSQMPLEHDQQSMLEYDLTDSEEDGGSPGKGRESDGSPKMLGSSMKKLRGARMNTRMSASSSKGG